MQSVERPTFQQAGIRIERLEEYGQLHSALTRIFAPAGVEKFLRLLQRKGVPVRDFDRILRQKLLEKADPALVKTGESAQRLYDALTTSDQAQMREFYLTTLEAVDQPLRERFNKLYRYY